MYIFTIKDKKQFFLTYYNRVNCTDKNNQVVSHVENITDAIAEAINLAAMFLTVTGVLDFYGYSLLVMISRTEFLLTCDNKVNWRYKHPVLLIQKILPMLLQN